MLRLLAPLALVLATRVAVAAPPVVVVLTPRAPETFDLATTRALGERLVGELTASGALQVLGRDDVLPFLDDTGQAQLEACDDDSACLVEVGGALGARYIVAPTLSSFGGRWTLTLRFLAPGTAGVVLRESIDAEPEEAALGEGLCRLVAGSLVKLQTKDRDVVPGPSRCGGANGAVAIAPSALTTIPPAKAREAAPKPIPLGHVAPKSSSRALVWTGIGVGVAAVAGVAAYFLLRDDGAVGTVPINVEWTP